MFFESATVYAGLQQHMDVPTTVEGSDIQVLRLQKETD